MSNRSMRSLAALMLTSLAACTSIQPGWPAPDETPAFVCNQAPLAQFVGREATQQLGAEMLAASHSRVIRWTTIGMMLTMEFRADRVTVRIDKANRVLAANCG